MNNPTITFSVINLSDWLIIQELSQPTKYFDFIASPDSVSESSGLTSKDTTVVEGRTLIPVCLCHYTANLSGSSGGDQGAGGSSS